MTDPIDRLRTALSDRYTIEHELGAGGMATVYLAHDHKHDRKVAIKVLRPELAAVLGAERFLQEIKVTANLHHPHILELYDSGDADGALYYMMPYVEGESLRDRLNRDKQLPIDDAMAVAREVADALSFAHSRGVVHRDIKPENILLEAGHAVIADFGIARAVSVAGGERLTETGLALGTPAYMSPEQAAGTGDLDGRSDVYALGCVLYEMLAGQPPFTGVTAESLIHQHVTVEAPPVTNTRPSVQPAVSSAIAKALAKTPADRFATANEFAQALEPSSSGAVAETSADAVEMRWTHPVRVAAAFGVAAAIALVVVYALMIALGLPDWVFVGAVVLLAIGLPVVLTTGHHERRRAVARTSRTYVPTPTGVRRHFTWRKAIVGGGLAFTGLGFVTAGYMAMRALGDHALPRGAPAVHDGEPRFADGG